MRAFGSSPLAGARDRLRVIRGFGAASVRNRLAVGVVAVALAVTVVDQVAVLLHAEFPPPGPSATDLSLTLAPPSASHLMGTDELGRDVFARVVAGARVSIEVALLVVLIGLVVGTLVGVVAGFSGGLVDEALMRVTDLFLAFPALILAAAIAATIGRSLQATVVALAIVWWPWYARLARGQVLSLREQEYVLAARGLGASRLRLMFRTILPNVVPTVTVQGAADIGYAMLSTAGLSFLGLGAQPPTPEWGSMILQSLSYQPMAWWYATFPGLALTVTAFGFNLLGDGLRDWLDPAMRGHHEQAPPPRDVHEPAALEGLVLPTSQSGPERGVP
jgi:peptide/nickel transport system permease protein